MTEEEFFAGLEAVFRYGTRPNVPMVSTATISRARHAAHALEVAAEEFAAELRRLSRGWRRVRLLRRLRVAREYVDARENADALWGTFGRWETSREERSGLRNIVGSTGTLG